MALHKGQSYAILHGMSNHAQLLLEQNKCNALLLPCGRASRTSSRPRRPRSLNRSRRRSHCKNRDGGDDS